MMRAANSSNNRMGSTSTVAARLSSERPLPIGSSSNPPNRRVKGRASAPSGRRPANRPALSKPARAVNPESAGMRVSDTTNEVSSDRHTVMA